MRYLRQVLALALFLPTTLAGQSVLGSYGLGMRLEPLDAVQRALGGVGVVTRTATVLPGNPVASLDVLVPTIAFTMQPHWGRYTVDSDKGSFFGTRFPVIGFVYPLGTDGVVTLTAGSQFDQNWSVESTGSLDVGGGASIGITDRFISDGAIAVIQLGWARRWSPTLALGASVGVYRGGLTRAFLRTFDPGVIDSVVVATPIKRFVTSGTWSHSGPLASLNVSWDPVPVLQVGATVAWGGTVKVSPADGSEGLSRKVSVPLEFKVGVVTVLSPTLALSAGASVSNWSDLGDPSVDQAGGGKIMSYGAGVEWASMNFWAGGFPLRMGFRRSVLPFRFRGNRVKENTISFGFSVVMAQVFELPVAALDLAIEVGSRNSGGFKENFRRLTATTRVGGF